MFYYCIKYHLLSWKKGLCTVFEKMGQHHALDPDHLCDLKQVSELFHDEDL